jgi:Ran GTPase-activating protein (RanGAP) involved in mRNA processing and transport
MSVSNDPTSTGDGASPLSLTFLECCAKVRNNDPSILPECGKPFEIRHLSEKEVMELADALLVSTNITYLELDTAKFTKSSAEAMAKFVRTSKRLQRIHWIDTFIDGDNREFRRCEQILCCYLHAIQESTSLKELYMELPRGAGRPSNLALENMLTHTQSLQSLTLICQAEGDKSVAAARSGLKKNTTLRELTLESLRGATIVSPILTSLRDHPSLRKLCLRGESLDLTGLETVLLSDTSKITELDIHGSYVGPPVLGLTEVLQALGRHPHPMLTKLGLGHCVLDRDDARLLRMALRNMPSLQTLVLKDGTLGSAEFLAGLAPALYHNTSIKMLDISNNKLTDRESAGILRDILRSNKTITTLDLCGNRFEPTLGTIECFADGLGSNSTLLKLDLTGCYLGDNGVTTLAQTLGSRNTTLQKLILAYNSITSMGVGVIVETMEQSHSHITDLDLHYNETIGNEGASLLARSLGNNALPNLTRLSLSRCSIGYDGFIVLMSALEQNNSLLNLDLRYNYGISERVFLALAESLPEIKVLQGVDFEWCTGLAPAMPLLLAGLRKNTSLLRFHVTDCAPNSVPPTPAQKAKCAGGWMQEMERLGYRNRFLPMISAPKEKLPPRGVWPHALARVVTLPDVIFEVLRSKPNLVPSEETGGKVAAKDTGVPAKRKRGDD